MMTVLSMVLLLAASACEIGAAADVQRLAITSPERGSMKDDLGKENPKYTPFIDTGDHVVVINAEKIKITGMKADQKVYHRYTGYPGGLRSEEMKKRMVRKPELVIEDAVSRMLPKNKLGKQMFTKLKVYRGDKHPHEAQKPEAKVFAS